MATPSKSPVKRPPQPTNAKEEELFDKLVAVSLSYNNTQFEGALKAIADLKKEGLIAKKEGHDMKIFERELKRQENRHKMDEFDGV